MIKSMTGFGKGQAACRAAAIVVEIRSLNHKYFDLVMRLPNHFCVLEDKLRDYVKRRIRRGRINLSVSWESKEKEESIFSLDTKLAKRYYRELMRLKRTLGLSEGLKLTDVMSLPEVINCQQKKQSSGELWPALKRATDAALNKLNRMRQREGRRLADDLSQRLKIVSRCLGNIEAQLPRVIGVYKEKLLRKVKSLSGAKKLDRDRIAEEVALFVRNIDVSEELTRIKSHLKGFAQALDSQKEAGKELDFIAQELFREANTIGAKSADFKISRWVIKIKSQVEKMREQLQNVE